MTNRIPEFPYLIAEFLRNQQNRWGQFIVNLGGATAADVRALIAEAKARVQAKFGIQLEEEVLLIGCVATR